MNGQNGKKYIKNVEKASKRWIYSHNELKRWPSKTQMKYLQRMNKKNLKSISKLSIKDNI